MPYTAQKPSQTRLTWQRKEGILINKVFALIGPAGSGKSALVKELRKHGIPMLVSHTTRPAKTGEQHGVDYYFVNSEQFAQARPFERVSYNGYLFGMTKEEVAQKLNQYPASIVDIDRDGFDQLKKLIGERMESIFILVDQETIFSRFVMNGEKFEDVKARIDYAEAKGEYDNWRIADHVVKNTRALDRAALQILAIMGKVKPMD